MCLHSITYIQYNIGLQYVKQFFINGMGSHVYERAKNAHNLCLESGDINKWDLSLLGFIFTSNEFSINCHKSTEFQKQMKRENENIQQLVNIRNKCAQNPNKTLTYEEFHQLFNELIVILVSFGESEKELKQLKNKSRGTLY